MEIFILSHSAYKGTNKLARRIISISYAAVPLRSQDLRSTVTASPLIAESDTVHGYYTITT